MPVMTARRLVALLLQLGFFYARQCGSHATYRHPDGRTTVIPMHTGDIASGTLRIILKSIKITTEQLCELL